VPFRQIDSFYATKTAYRAFLFDVAGGRVFICIAAEKGSLKVVSVFFHNAILPLAISGRFMKKLHSVMIPVAAMILCCCLARHVFASAQDRPSSIVITGYDKTASTQFMPGEAVVYRAGFTFSAPSAVILRGTVTGKAWSASLGQKIFAGFPGPHEVSWADAIPAYALGDARVDITMTRLLKKPGGENGAFALFSVGADAAEYTGSAACGECHEHNYAAWEKNRHAPIPACEECHGPGRRHDAADNESFVFVDTQGAVCIQCHFRNDATVIEAENGFIKYYQEHNEIRNTAHGRYKPCTSCHNPHYNMRQDRARAIVTTCGMCHPEKRAALHPASIRCEDCHMPKAAVRETAEGEGLYRRGDFAAHIIRIKTSAAPDAMFDDNQTALVQDEHGPFLTLNFACLGCHDGEHAGKADMESVRKAAKLIHGQGR